MFPVRNLALAAPHSSRRPHTRRSLLSVIVLMVGLFVPAFIGAQPASATLMTTTEQTVAKAVLLLLNVERTAHGARPLTVAYPLTLSARRHNKAMAAANVMSHQLPGEAYFATRISRAGYKWKWAGENIAWNSDMTTAGVKLLESLMYNEKAPNDGHRQNILSRNFKNVGIDVLMDFKHHKVWLTEDFGEL